MVIWFFTKVQSQFNGIKIVFLTKDLYPEYSKNTQNLTVRQQPEFFKNVQKAGMDLTNENNCVADKSIEYAQHHQPSGNVQ